MLFVAWKKEEFSRKLARFVLFCQIQKRLSLISCVFWRSPSISQSINQEQRLTCTHTSTLALTHSLTYWLINSLNQSEQQFTCTYTHTYSHTRLLTQSLTHLLTHSVNQWINQSETIFHLQNRRLVMQANPATKGELVESSWTLGQYILRVNTS